MFIFSRQKLLKTFFKTKLNFVLWHYLEIREKRISEEEEEKKKKKKKVLKASTASQSDRTLPGANSILDLIRSGYRTLPIVILMKNIPFSFKTLVFNRFFGTNRSKYALFQ